MKIALCSSFVPFIYGGDRNIVEWLEEKLLCGGHRVEKIYLPQADAPALIFGQKAAYRWVDLTESADRIICLRPPAHVIPHPNKVLWFIHHIRVFYDLWGTDYCPVPDNDRWRGFRQALMETDTVAFQEARRVFTNSRVVSNRLTQFNGVSSTVLYPPLLNPERFKCAGQNDEVVYVSRVEHHKRQHLLVEAMAYVHSPVKLRLCGASSTEQYSRELRAKIDCHNLQDRVMFEDRWINEEEKVSVLANCLAAAYIPLNEDSYGYSSLEASHSQKPILTTTDSGGVLELVKHGVNGLVAEPDPRALAEALDSLYLDRENARRMGIAAEERIGELKIEWPYVLDRLLS